MVASESQMVKDKESTRATCSVCYKSMKLRNLKDHMLYVHSNERRIKCDHCPKTFKFRNSCNSHMRTFHEENKTTGSDEADIDYKQAYLLLREQYDELQRRFTELQQSISGGNLNGFEQFPPTIPSDFSNYASGDYQQSYDGSIKYDQYAAENSYSDIKDVKPFGDVVGNVNQNFHLLDDDLEGEEEPGQSTANSFSQQNQLTEAPLVSALEALASSPVENAPFEDADFGEIEEFHFDMLQAASQASSISAPIVSGMDFSALPSSKSAELDKIVTVRKKSERAACHICSKIVLRKKLREHMVHHTGERRFKCHRCSQKFFRKYNLDKHLRTHGRKASLKGLPRNDVESQEAVPELFSNDGPDEKESELSRTNALIHADVDLLMAPYKEEKEEKSKTAVCPICRKTVMRRKLKEHIIIHSDQKFCCHLCQKTFHRKYNLDRHLAVHARLSQGSEAMATNEDRKDDKDGQSEESQHQRKEESQPRKKEAITNIDGDPERFYQCELCPNTYKVKPHLQEHMFTHTEERPNECQVCSKGFKSAHHLRAHMRRTHPDVFPDYYPSGTLKSTKLPKQIPKPFKEPAFTICTICGMTLRDRNKLKEHMIVHSDERPFQCEQCEMTFKSNQRLKRHKIKHDENRRVYHCDVCDAVLGSRSSLRSHQLVHKKDSPFQCPLCPRTFKTNLLLKSHSRVHSDERPFQCVICGKSFKDPSTLRDHGGVHMTERPFTCTQCGKGYKTRHNLQLHKQWVHGTKDIPCEICGKRFKCNFYLKNHMKTHRAT